MISFAAITEYYYLYMSTQSSKKYYQNRINWAYYVVRNYIAYGKLSVSNIPMIKSILIKSIIYGNTIFLI